VSHCLAALEAPKVDPKKVGGASERDEFLRAAWRDSWRGTPRVVAGVLKARDGLEHLALLPLRLVVAGQEGTLLGAA
jgi:hypothetical protein